MTSDKLHIYKEPKLNNCRLLLGFSGWMDSGDVSTATIKWLIQKLDAYKIAQIDPEGFYIYNFPGPMELTALFRPHTRIEDGLIEAYETGTNEFFCDEKNNLILFLGKEPNLQWHEFADCIFSLCKNFDVKMLYFIGSVSGLVPHTREPMFSCSVSDAELKETFEHYGVKFTNYEGPASIVTYLTNNAGKWGLSMASLVATVPAYVHGNNPICIEAVIRRVAGILGVHAELGELREISNKFEKKLTDLVGEQPELSTNVHKLEEAYDNEIFNSEMGDLKQWLEQQGIRVD